MKPEAINQKLSKLSGFKRDYAADLNALAMLEHTLSESQIEAYGEAIRVYVKFSRGFRPLQRKDFVTMATIPPIERARLLLKILH